ncbi:MAG: TonB-dependent receptor [Gemmatimonadaceae bacterium]
MYAYLVFIAALPLGAQEQSRDTARVEPVVVTATRIPISQGSLPVAVTVITGDELRLRGVTTVADALRDVTSAYVAQTGSPGATTSLFLRGGESKYVKVLVDGVPANDPGGTYDFASLTTDNIERIEIVRGPASVIHGADAVTGVVHVITRRGRGPSTSEGELRVGRTTRERLDPPPNAPAPGPMWSLDATGSTSGSLASGSYSVGIARHEATGLYELNNRYQNNVLSGRFHFTPVNGTELRVSLRYNDYKFNYPTNGGGTVVDSNAHRTEDRSLLGVELERKLSSSARTVLTLNSSVNDGGTDDQMDAANGSSFISQDKTRRRGAELRVHLEPAASTAVTVGAQIEQQDQRSQFQSQSPFGPFNSSFKAARRNAGAYAEVLLTSADNVTATLGARVDDNEQFGQFGTTRVGLSWRPRPTTRLRATGGTAFREPSFFENYSTGFVVGNPDLQPERTTSWDAGIDQELFAGRAQVAVTGFAQRFVNMIDYDPGNSCGFSYCNVAKATSNGVEAEVSGRVAGPLWASAGATFLRTEVVEPGFDNTSGGLYRRDESLIRRPERKVTAELSYRGTGRLSAAARVLAVGIRHDRDFRPFPATPVTLPSYERIDLGAEYRLPTSRVARSSLTLRVENLTDEKYQNVFNFLAPRRTVAIGVRSMF